MPPWNVLTNWVAAVRTMPTEYILSQPRYDNPNANEMPRWIYISGELSCDNRLQAYEYYDWDAYEVIEHAFFAAVTTLGLNGPMI